MVFVTGGSLVMTEWSGLYVSGSHQLVNLRSRADRDQMMGMLARGCEVSVRIDVPDACERASVYGRVTLSTVDPVFGLPLVAALTPPPAPTSLEGETAVPSAGPWVAGRGLALQQRQRAWAVIGPSADLSEYYKVALDSGEVSRGAAPGTVALLATETGYMQNLISAYGRPSRLLGIMNEMATAWTWQLLNQDNTALASALSRRRGLIAAGGGGMDLDVDLTAVRDLWLYADSNNGQINLLFECRKWHLHPCVTPSLGVSVYKKVPGFAREEPDGWFAAGTINYELVFAS